MKLNNQLKLLIAFAVMAFISLFIYLYVKNTIDIKDIPEISVSELRERLSESKRLLLIDVRPETQSALKKPEIPGAISIPLEKFPEKVKFFETKSIKTFVVYGNIEQRSKAAVLFLIEKGYKARYLKGGLQGWYAYGTKSEK